MELPVSVWETYNVSGPSTRRHLLRAVRLAQDDMAWRVSLKWTTVMGQSYAKLGSGGIHREGVRIAGIADIARHRRNREGPRLTLINSAGTDRKTGLSGNRNIGDTGNQETGDPVIAHDRVIL